MSNNTTLGVLDPTYIQIYQSTKVYLTVYLGWSFITGMIGNGLVVAVHSKIQEKCATDWFIFYIAVCDILAVLNVPMYICQLLGYWARYNFPDILCQLHYMNSNSVSIAAYICGACAAIERYFKVVLSRNVFSLTQAKFLQIMVFVFSYGVALINIWATVNNDNGHCMFRYSTRHLAVVQYVIVMMVAFSCSMVMIVCYLCIGIYLSRRMTEILQSNKSESFIKSYHKTIQMTKMLAIVTIVFLISANTPYISMVYLMVKFPTEEPDISILMCLSTMFFINTFFNPFLYFGMNATFRRRVKHLMSC